MLLKTLLILALKCSCGWSSRIPDNVYFTTSPSVDELHATGSDLNTHLVAPSASSYSQYFQHLHYPQLNYFQQAPQLSPFLYSGPLIMMLTQAEQAAHNEEADSTEKSLPIQEESSYSLYRPNPADNPQFVDMQPPSEAQEELDYYVVKPKKNKKYSAAVEEKKKYTKKKENLKAQIVHDEQEDLNDAKEETDYDYDAPSSSTEVTISAKLTNDSDSARKERDTDSSEKADTSVDSVETSAPASRIDFQMHAHKGPKTYKFGYDTGKGKNRQFKVEEKDENGNVLGQYGYYDDVGKLRIVKYSSMANDGFKIL